MLGLNLRSLKTKSYGVKFIDGLNHAYGFREKRGNTFVDEAGSADLSSYSGRCLSFDSANNSYAEIHRSSIENTFVLPGGTTLYAVVDVTFSLTGANKGHLINSIGNQSAENGGLYLRVNNQSTLTISACGFDANGLATRQWASALFPSTLALNQIYQLKAVYSTESGSATTTLYLDGAEFAVIDWVIDGEGGEPIVSFNLAHSQPIVFGRNGTINTDYLSGSIFGFSLFLSLSTGTDFTISSDMSMMREPEIGVSNADTGSAFYSTDLPAISVVFHKFFFSSPPDGDFEVPWLINLIGATYLLSAHLGDQRMLDLAGDPGSCGVKLTAPSDIATNFSLYGDGDSTFAMLVWVKGSTVIDNEERILLRLGDPSAHHIQLRVVARKLYLDAANADNSVSTEIYPNFTDKWIGVRISVTRSDSLHFVGIYDSGSRTDFAYTNEFTVPGTGLTDGYQGLAIGDSIKSAYDCSVGAISIWHYSGASSVDNDELVKFIESQHRFYIKKLDLDTPEATHRWSSIYNRFDDPFMIHDDRNGLLDQGSGGIHLNRIATPILFTSSVDENLELPMTPDDFLNGLSTVTISFLFMFHSDSLYSQYKTVFSDSSGGQFSIAVSRSVVICLSNWSTGPAPAYFNVDLPYDEEMQFMLRLEEKKADLTIVSALTKEVIFSSSFGAVATGSVLQIGTAAGTAANKMLVYKESDAISTTISNLLLTESDASGPDISGFNEDLAMGRSYKMSADSSRFFTMKFDSSMASDEIVETYQLDTMTQDDFDAFNDNVVYADEFEFVEGIGLRSLSGGQKASVTAPYLGASENVIMPMEFDVELSAETNVRVYSAESSSKLEAYGAGSYTFQTHRSINTGIDFYLPLDAAVIITALYFRSGLSSLLNHGLKPVVTSGANQLSPDGTIMMRGFFASSDDVSLGDAYTLDLSRASENQPLMVFIGDERRFFVAKNDGIGSLTLEYTNLDSEEFYRLVAPKCDGALFRVNGSSVEVVDQYGVKNRATETGELTEELRAIATGKLHLGHELANYSSYNGIMAGIPEVSIYDRALSNEEIANVLKENA